MAPRRGRRAWAGETETRSDGSVEASSGFVASGYRDAFTNRGSQNPSPPSAVPRAMASFSREFAVIDTRLEYLELTRAGAMEVFAVDPAELASVHGVPVPEHGAFVGRVLPPESLEGEDAAVLDVQTGAKTRVFRRDAGQATVVPAPRVAPGALRAHESSLVLLNDDWFVLGLRFEVDAEVRRAFNLHGFASLGRGHLRCFVVPEDEDVGARVLVTVGRHALEPAIAGLDVFDAAEPPALDLLRAFVEGPTAAPSPSTRERGAERLEPETETETETETDGDKNARVRNAAGLFPHQARTVRWMASVECGAEGDDDCGASLRESEPVRFGGRSLFPSGRETKRREEEEDADAAAAAAAAAKGDRRAGRFGAARAVEAALTSALRERCLSRERRDLRGDLRDLRGRLQRPHRARDRLAFPVRVIPRRRSRAAVWSRTRRAPERRSSPPRSSSAPRVESGLTGLGRTPFPERGVSHTRPTLVKA